MIMVLNSGLHMEKVFVQEVKSFVYVRQCSEESIFVKTIVVLIKPLKIYLANSVEQNYFGRASRSFLISSFRRVQNIVCFLLGNYPPGNYPKENTL